MPDIISAIVPVYNRTGPFTRAVKSIINQTRPVDELIIVDDGSPSTGDVHEHTQFEAICRPLLENLSPNSRPKTTFIRLDENRGPAAARNAGIKASRGNLLAFLDSDDEWHPEKTARQADYMHTRPWMLYSHTDEAWFFNHEARRPKKRHRKQGGFFFRRSLSLCLVSPSAVMMRPEFFADHRAGLWNESLRVAEDYELWIRAGLVSAAGYIDQPLTIKHGGEGDQLSSRYYNIDFFRLTALVNIMRTCRLTRRRRKLVSAELLHKFLIVEAGFRKHGREFPTELKDQIAFYCPGFS